MYDQVLETFRRATESTMQFQQQMLLNWTRQWPQVFGIPNPGTAWVDQAHDIQKKWAAAGGVPSRTDALQSPEFLDASPFNKVYAESVSRMRDMWNVPQYAKLIDIENTNVNAALNGAKSPEDALNEIAKEQQDLLDSGGSGL